MEPQQPQNKLSIPVAIVIAGFVIAAAVFLSNYKGNATPIAAVPANSEPQVSAVTIAPLTAKDHILGNSSAAVTMVEYSDTECPFCKQFHPTLTQIMSTLGKDGKVAWVYRHFPLVQLHPKAPKEAEAAECANELGSADGSTFWKFINQVYAITPSNNGLDPAELPKIAADLGLSKTAFQACLDSGRYTEKINASVEDATNAGGRGTPFTVLVVKTPLSASTISSIGALVSRFPPDTITISQDKLRVAVSGALPYSFLEQIIKTILGNA